MTQFCNSNKIQTNNFTITLKNENILFKETVAKKAKNIARNVKISNGSSLKRKVTKNAKRHENVLLKLQLQFKNKIVIKNKKAKRCLNTDKGKKKKPLANLINLTCPARSFQLIGKFA